MKRCGVALLVIGVFVLARGAGMAASPKLGGSAKLTPALPGPPKTFPITPIDPKGTKFIDLKVIDPKVSKIVDPKVMKLVDPKVAKVVIDPKVVKIIDPKVMKIVVDPKVSKIIDPKIAKIVVDPKVGKIIDPKIAKIVIDPKVGKIIDPKIAKIVIDPKVGKIIDPKIAKVVINPKIINPKVIVGHCCHHVCWPVVCCPIVCWHPVCCWWNVFGFAEVVPVQYERWLRLHNDTPEHVTVYLRYHTTDLTGQWDWIPEPPGPLATKWLAFELAPGQVMDPRFMDVPIAANRIRVWAESATRTWESFKEDDFWLVPEVLPNGEHLYFSDVRQTFTFRITPK